MKKIFLCLALLSFLGCEDDENRFFELGEFRILAVQADTPEIDGTSSTPIAVSLTPIVSDIDAGTRNIDIDILACPDPGLQLGNEPSCDATLATTQSIPYAQISSATLGSRKTGAMPAFTVNVPPGLLTGQSSQTKFNGLDYLITMKFKAGSETLDTYKRITVSERTTKNTNPNIQNVLLDGNSTGSLSNRDKLTIDLASGSNEENYDYENLDGIQSEKTEVYTTSWFTFKGTTDLRRTFMDETAIFEINEDEANPFVMAILRDDRGGVAFKLRE